MATKKAAGMQSKTQPKRKHKSSKQNKPHGHFCYVCGEHKSNEKFSGRGHANHICRKCHALPVADRNEMIAIRKIDNMAFRYLSKAEIKWLRKKMNDSRPEVRAAAQTAYHIKFPNHDHDLSREIELKSPVLFSELDDDQKESVTERLDELIGDFLLYSDVTPDDADRDEILAELCEDVSEIVNQWEPEPYDPSSEIDPRFDFAPDIGFDEKIALINEILEADAEDFDPYEEPEEPEPKPQKELIPDHELKTLFDGILAQFLSEMKAEGIELPASTEEKPT